MVGATYRARSSFHEGLTSSWFRTILHVVETKQVQIADVVTTIRLTRAEHDWLKQTAARERRTFSQQLRYFLAQAAEREAQERAA